MKDNKKKIEERPIQGKEQVKTKRISTGMTISLVVSIGLILVITMLVGQLLYDNGEPAPSQFYDNTSINGVDVSAIKKEEAVNMISSKLLSAKDDISIKLIYKDKEWILSGKDFETNSNIFPIVEQTFQKGRNGAVAERISTVRRVKEDKINIDVSYRHILGGFDDRIDNIIKEINVEPVNPHVVFDPSAETESAMFTISEGVNGYCVDKDLLYKNIDEALALSKNIIVEVITNIQPFEKPTKDLLANTKLRSSFSTDYSSSQGGRKNNVNVALSKFNGMVIEPNKEISFNEITGDKTAENGYQKAKIILNGIYVEDYGGGACQASTTLYNALILSDMEILEANPHSMPVSYVPLAFDAMVSEGYSDLRFKNNLEYPIYIKAWGDETRAYVNIYGKPLSEGEEIKRRAEFIEVLPHEGDMIVKDVNGEYSNKITYAGEYLRIKNPQEGYHSKAYIGYYKDGKLVSEKLIRDEIYKPQKGIVMEGTETLGEGMVIPENEVKIIPPQEGSQLNGNTVKKKIGEQNPIMYNP